LPVLNGARIAVIVPAYNEEKLIPVTLAGIPGFVDRILVVDDASVDDTARAASRCADGRTTVLRHDANMGVGAAIVTGYRAARTQGAQVLAVMAGDAQMDPDDLVHLVRPVACGDADYTKGDRLGHADAWDVMPRGRLIVGHVLSWLTGRAAGLARLSDSQCGYTAISAHALDAIDLDGLWPRYGYPNDLIGQIALAGLRIVEVPVRPVYGSETSGVRPWHVITIGALVARTAWRRLASPSRELPSRRFRLHAGVHAKGQSTEQSPSW
jgi:glycosyltransferase involved in cell wall biosynthesis